METARGRWFLAEFAKRNRTADTSVLLDAIRTLHDMLSSQVAQADSQHTNETGMNFDQDRIEMDTVDIMEPDPSASDSMNDDSPARIVAGTSRIDWVDRNEPVTQEPKSNPLPDDELADSELVMPKSKPAPEPEPAIASDLAFSSGNEIEARDIAPKTASRRGTPPIIKLSPPPSFSRKGDEEEAEQIEAASLSGLEKTILFS